MGSTDQWSTCSVVEENCVKWVEKYFKDCVCNLSSEISFGLGLVSLFCWGIAEIPQIITNFQTQSGHGVSLGLLLTWFIGDIFNLVGCLLEPVTLPTQFYTALLYTAATVVLLLQTIYYDYYIRWWKNKGFEATHEVAEERKPLNLKKDDGTKPISTTATTSPQIDVHYTSARSLANSGSSPFGGASSYLRIARSGPSDVGAAFHDSSSEDEEHEACYRSTNTKPKRTASRSLTLEKWLFMHGVGCNITRIKILSSLTESICESGWISLNNSAFIFNLKSLVKSMPQSLIKIGKGHDSINGSQVGYGTFIIGSAGLPFQAKALMEMHVALYGKNMLQELEANPYGILLGWIMAAIYMGGRLPQIYLNIKRGNVEGLNPLMFIFALIANATYVGSILARSVEWDRIKPNAPWLLDAIVCVLLDLFIIIQFAYYKVMRRTVNHRHDSMDAKKLIV